MIKFARVVVDAVLGDKQIWDYIVPDNLDIKEGSVITVPFGRREVEGFVLSLSNETDVDPKLLKAISSVSENLIVKQELLSLLPEITDKFKLRYIDVLRLFIPNTIRNTKPKRNGKRRAPQIMDRVDNKVVLNAEQVKCVESVVSGKGEVFLLKGVTGSGKTEVYMNIIKQVLAMGKTALVLVPEIGLTPQVVSNFNARFGDIVAVLHSKLYGGEKFDEWMRIVGGEARIVIGARSAVFAPLDNIGVIIIDEEHDGSYQSDSNPRYMTHDIAVMRSKKNNCSVVLGSATPSIENFHLAKQGKYKLLELTKRVNDVPLPIIDVVDMVHEIRSGNGGIFARNVLMQLLETLRQGRSAIVFLNRRGYSQSVRCVQCGWTAKCQNCDVSLVYHKDEEKLKCHYCATRMTLPSKCPDCGGTYLKHGVMGTQKICGELSKLLEDANVKASVIRMDADNTKNKGDLIKILDEFGKSSPAVLVGTQMIAKGHHFPDVDYVCVVNADAGFFGDYRAAERTFSLLTQVAGRAGREVGINGKVFIQTYMPSHYVYKFVKEYDYEGFYEKEINNRSITQYPPFASIVRVLVSGEVDTKIISAIKEIMEPLREYDKQTGSFIYLGAMKCPYPRLQNKFRYQILARIKEEKTKASIDAMDRYVKAVQSKPIAKSVKIFLEINPGNLS